MQELFRLGPGSASSHALSAAASASSASIQLPRGLGHQLPYRREAAVQELRAVVEQEGAGERHGLRLPESEELVERLAYCSGFVRPSVSRTLPARVPRLNGFCKKVTLDS